MPAVGRGGSSVTNLPHTYRVHGDARAFGLPGPVPRYISPEETPPAVPTQRTSNFKSILSCCVPYGNGDGTPARWAWSAGRRRRFKASPTRTAVLSYRRRYYYSALARTTGRRVGRPPVDSPSASTRAPYAYVIIIPRCLLIIYPFWTECFTAMCGAPIPSSYTTDFLLGMSFESKENRRAGWEMGNVQNVLAILGLFIAIWNCQVPCGLNCLGYTRFIASCTW